MRLERGQVDLGDMEPVGLDWVDWRLSRRFWELPRLNYVEIWVN